MSQLIEIKEYRFELLPQRGLYWPDQRALMVADLHLGKDATFRHHAIPVPRGSCAGTLYTVSEMLAETSAASLYLLGDLFHARSSLARDVLDALDSFFQRHRDIAVTLVLGNHDRHVAGQLSEFPMDVVKSVMLEQVALSHQPSPLTEHADLLICGHVHPAIRIGPAVNRVGTFPCFWLSKGCLVLPAAGEFTGTHVVRCKAGDRAWVVCEDQVLDADSCVAT